jgi:hypothetical protein
MSPRSHIGWQTKCASALLALGHIPYEDAKQMTAAQLCSLYQFHHNVRHAESGGDHFSNLEPMLIAPHRKRTAEIDVPAIAKAKRVTHKHEEFRRRLLAKQPGVSARPPSRWPKGRKIRSRGFR